eukprot:UN22493
MRNYGNKEGRLMMIEWRNRFCDIQNSTRELSTLTLDLDLSPPDQFFRVESPWESGEFTEDMISWSAVDMSGFTPVGQDGSALLDGDLETQFNPIDFNDGYNNWYVTLTVD